MNPKRPAKATLRFQSLEQRDVPASMNAQYNVELQTHAVSAIGIDTGYDHLSILITPKATNPYTDNDGDDRADQDPMFVKRSDGSFALSIGAGGDSLTGIGGNLKSEFNRPKDIAVHPANERYTLTKPAIYKDSRTWVNALISKAAGYGDNLTYDTFPEDSTEVDYNSNSYIAGILAATGTTVPANASIFTGNDHPGYLTPVPTTAFGTTPAQRVDLMIVVDTTGSMYDDIDAAKAAATDIINLVHDSFQVDGTTDVRIGVVDYRDFPVEPYGYTGDYPYNLMQSFASDPETAVAGINALALGDGNDWPESVYSALMYSIQSEETGSWRGEGVSKMLIIMGDAPGHSPEPFTGYTAADVIEAAINEDPVVVFPVAIGYDYGPEFQEIATGTGGQLIPALDAGDVVAALTDAIGTISETPISEANGPYASYTGAPVNLSALGSFDPNGTIVSYEWDFESDGTYDRTTTEPSTTYTWTQEFTGRVRVRVTDDSGLVNFDWADVVIEPLPLDVYGVDAGKTLKVGTGKGILANDPKLPKQKLTAQLVETTANGTLTLKADGSFVYVPGPGFAGLDTFTYKAVDSANPANESEVRTVTLATQIVNFRKPKVTVGEQATTGVLTVDLRVAPTTEITVPYSVIAKTATGSDYTLASGYLTFAAGQKTQTIPLDLTNDSTDEAKETFLVRLEPATGVTIGTKNSAVVTIKDDDAAPDVTFNVATDSNYENVSGSARIDLSAPSSLPITVNYTVSGTAKFGQDHNLKSGKITLAPGSTGGFINIPMINDNTYEANPETIIIKLTKATNGKLKGFKTLTNTVYDDEYAPSVQFAATDSTVGEAGGTIPITLTLTNPSATAITIMYTITGDATKGSDYAALSGKVTFKPGETTKTIDVKVLNDSKDETDETIILELTDADGAYIWYPYIYTLTLTDDDPIT